MENIVTFIEQIEDPRNPKGIRHNQTANILIMIMAIMCGHTGFNAMARFAKSHCETLLKFIPLPRKKAPSSSTLQRLSKAIDFEQLCNAFNDWMIQYCKKEGIAIDGKSINSTVSSCHDSKQNFVSLVSFFGQQSGLIWHVSKLENGKSSEITEVQQMLKMFDIKHCIFTLDALHCQKKTVEAIVDSDNGYVITVKKNQPKLYNSIKEQTQTPPEDSFSWKQKGHGHNVNCRIKVWPAPETMVEQWAGLSKVISVIRSGHRDGKDFCKQTYYITSEAISAYRLSKLIRGHRRIENNLHWTKDVILNEDNCQISEPNQAATLGVMRDIGFNLHIMQGFSSITEAISQVEGKIDKLWEIIINPVKKVFNF